MRVKDGAGEGGWEETVGREATGDNSVEHNVKVTSVSMQQVVGSLT